MALTRSHFTNEDDMTMVQGNCKVCGAPVVVEAPPGFEGAELIGCVCPTCADAELLEKGGAVFAPPHLEGALFPLGSKVTVTPRAVAVLKEANLDALDFVARHVCGDWGRGVKAADITVTDSELKLGQMATEDDDKLNKIAVLTGQGRVLSNYALPNGGRLWVLTSLGAGGYTTAMLPEDY